eukprot:7463953-Pyramimonas_sp.AAC.1
MASMLKKYFTKEVQEKGGGILSTGFALVGAALKLLKCELCAGCLMRHRCMPHVDSLLFSWD